ncbi:hypothetical protein COCC4DRAFT_176275 [Bipolaris maydis ATCC 48331]|uniref:BTB domain-containing protein n=2 Tax=Cochliobolus heterostrophus TaxID=5016 RepID=M2V4L2_COCH5|nr:uncharacterized protein COCC4DRAFT_176275 [Bipolaris maydis ATCC 48331]EMD94927.1 hypothetical protein COCHEDRAFT_1191698 [Bipolaris maydis C5]ENI01782.1 hypothetical protein COCC4DRAFT_176275 [Bipolaris maydis ATCC 48331]KAJ6214915.1 hypothetical protein PSV09DRAFT_1191698 [Bipolaris maydis]KAJ6287205.1 hypothetical protein J3E71DRAFT_208526 [Bipolaris maydis]
MSISDNSTLGVSHEQDGTGDYLHGFGDLAISAEDRSSYNPSFIKQSVPLPELDLATAHTLVHYLYTGKYQTLGVHAGSDKIIPESYKLSVCVYCAAVRYRLPGLAELAQTKIKLFGEDVTIFDMLAVARQHAFPLLPEDDAWYPAYIEDALRNAVTEDPTPFRKPDFITTVEGSSRLLQLVWKTMMSNYVPKPATPTSTPIVRADSVVAHTLEPVPDISESHGNVDPGIAIESEDASNSKREDVAEPQSLVEEPTKNALVAESVLDVSGEVGATASNPQFLATPESFTDGLGLMTSMKWEQMYKKAEQEAPISASPKEEPKLTGLVRTDSVTQFEQMAGASDPKTTAGNDANAETGQASASTSEVVPVKKGKKTKKMKITKKPAVQAEPVLASAA